VVANSQSLTRSVYHSPVCNLEATGEELMTASEGKKNRLRAAGIDFDRRVRQYSRISLRVIFG
jgi:hypothetical protein